ncbi:DsbC family protein [Aquimonas voraii]|uniref:Thiol:disulfide interchange protein n=1 Tax=Aquimonas voraii TaxID=265719 RepID=A0A1G6ZFV6_9GAMM|nr:DsbC family protein [Aquimonas voraii]SDE01127.1 Thiol:disulfide interchange protein DsbC [Aquimonas voraii]
MTRILAGAVIAALSLVATATPAIAQSGESAVRGAIETLVPNAKIDSVSESVVPNLYEVTIEGRVVYVTADGRYLIQGSLFDIPNRVDVTEASRAKVRREALAEVTTGRIVFAPPNPKYTLTVFTDIDCGYCRKMHEHMTEYNSAGIAIEYMFFPRAGIGSESYQKAVSVYCSTNQQKAMTDAKAGQPLDMKECENPIADQFNLSQKIGVTGTPAVFAEDGTQLGGYMPPDQLLQRLEAMAAAPKQ